MASVKTPPRKLNNNSQKRNLPNSPHGTETPVKAINKKVKKSDEAEEKEISLKDIYEMIASLKADIQDKHNKLEERMIALESRLDKKFEKLEKEVNEKVEKKMEKKKEEIESDINASFQVY